MFPQITQITQIRTYGRFSLFYLRQSASSAGKIARMDGD
jgi:hypothetical protein